MKTLKTITARALFVLAIIVGAFSANAQEIPPLMEQINNGNWFEESEAQELVEELYYHRALQAYFEMIPALNTIGLRDGSEAVFGKGYNILPIWKDRMDSRAWVPTPNADVIYSMSYLDLKETGPLVVAAIIPRLFMDDTSEDREALQPIINQIMVYPLSEYTGEMKTTNWKEAPAVDAGNTSGGETKWVAPEKFLDQLAQVLVDVPALPGEESMYGQFNALLTVLANNPELKAEVTADLVELDNTMIKDFLNWKYNGKPAGNGWNRSVNNAEWGLDYFNRTGTSRSNMFDNRPTETQYFYTDGTSNGEKLVGSNNYKVTFKAGELPPVHGFWSLTMYNEHHLFYPNELKRYSLGTKNTTLKYEEDGSLVLYAGTKSPGKDKESNWLPAPEGDFSIYLRAYQGKEGITSGSWTPPVIEKY